MRMPAARRRRARRGVLELHGGVTDVEAQTEMAPQRSARLGRATYAPSEREESRPRLREKRCSSKKRDRLVGRLEKAAGSGSSASTMLRPVAPRELMQVRGVPHQR